MSFLGLVVVLGVVGFVALAIYAAGHKRGKRLGSRKGYGVGFDRGRRSRGGQGCLLVLVLLLGLAALTAGAVFIF